MEAATIEAEPTVEAHDEPAEATSAAVQATPDKMFKFSEWVHVGEGAEECPTVTDPANVKNQGRGCEDEEHFHAFCRLPNQFQLRDIVEKATAAKARRIRLLNNAESDAFEVLDSTMRTIRATEDKDIIIDELLSYTWQQDYLEALQNVEDDERFEHIEQDRQEFRRLDDLPEAERPQEAYEALEKQMEAYSEAARVQLEAVQAPRRASYTALSMDELIGLLRDRRIEADSSEEYNHVFSQWEWFVGTRQPDRRTQKFSSIHEMTEEGSPETIKRLDEVFTDLRIAMQRGSGSGNS